MDRARGRGRHSPSTQLVFKVTSVVYNPPPPLSEIPGSAPAFENDPDWTADKITSSHDSQVDVGKKYLDFHESQVVCSIFPSTENQTAKKFTAGYYLCCTEI